eukprot:scaffold9876_cov77-Cyclotella_meneghiniana.AAC.2
MASRLPWPASSLLSATNSSILTACQKRWLSTAVTVMAVAPTLPLPRITPFIKQRIRLFPPPSKRRNNNVFVAFPLVPLVTMII